MPASCVKPCLKRGKADAADAEAIREAVTRPTMRFVPVKSAEQQAALMLHRTRDLLVGQRTMLVNGMRGHTAEIGIIAPQGISRMADLVAVLLGEDSAKLPQPARYALRGLATELEAPGNRVKEIEAANVATVTDPSQFHSARQFAAWMGLVPNRPAKPTLMRSRSLTT